MGRGPDPRTVFSRTRTDCRNRTATLLTTSNEGHPCRMKSGGDLFASFLSPED